MKSRWSEVLDIREHCADEEGERWRVGKPALLSLESIGRLRVQYVMWVAALWVVLVIISVLSGVCFFHNCKKLQTVSYAADKEPLTSIYSIGLSLYAVLAVPAIWALHIYMEKKIELIQRGHLTPLPPRIPCINLSSTLSAGHLSLLSNLNGLLRILILLGATCMVVQCTVPLHVSKPLHNQGGFLFLFLAILWVALFQLLSFRVRVCAADARVFRTQLYWMGVLALFAVGTTVQASFAYTHRSFWLNSRILAVFEALTALGGCLFPLTYTPLVSHMHVDGSFRPSILKLWSLRA